MGGIWIGSLPAIASIQGSCLPAKLWVFFPAHTASQTHRLRIARCPASAERWLASTVWSSIFHPIGHHVPRCDSGFPHFRNNPQCKTLFVVIGTTCPGRSLQGLQSCHRAELTGSTFLIRPIEDEVHGQSSKWWPASVASGPQRPHRRWSSHPVKTKVLTNAEADRLVVIGNVQRAGIALPEETSCDFSVDGQLQGSAMRRPPCSAGRVPRSTNDWRC